MDNDLEFTTGMIKIRRILFFILLTFFFVPAYAKKKEDERLACIKQIIQALGRDDFDLSPKEVMAGINKFKDREMLRREQDKALKLNLQKRGYKCNGSGYACLKRLSAENKKRILAGFSLEQALQDPDLAYLYKLIKKRFAVYFVHNSHHLNSKRPGMILSAKRLEALGLNGAGNTAPFNDQILGGSDNVFFFVNLYFTDKTIDPSESKSFYGPRTAIPHTVYAEEFGWISPFVMFPAELSDVMFSARGKGLKWGKYSPTDRSIQMAVPLLHQFDFTVRDFKDLTRILILRSLARTKVNEPKNFENIVADAKNPPRRNDDFDSAVSHALHSEFSFNHAHGLDFEFKIPVAVPERELTIK
ncbi:MAG: hypothetical protein J0L93_00655 [Deltaproteobacteria bacterium]|nr:hypothetical protein [Deltaproteobacteria bacterium]